MPANVYYRQPFDAICNPKQLVEYYIIDIEVTRDKDLHFFPGQGKISQKHVVADIWIVKASELGLHDNTIHTKTHMGHLLKPGDSVLGYNLEDANVNNVDFEKLPKEKIPEVILVKKYYGDLTTKRRNWKLKHFNDESAQMDDKDQK